MSPSSSCSFSSSPVRLFPPQMRSNMPLLHPHHIVYRSAPPVHRPSTSYAKIAFTRLLPIKSHLQQTTPTPTTPDPILLPKNLQDIVALFQSVQDSKAKYQQLLHYGKLVPPLDACYKTDEHRVRGCVSQVWVRAFPDPDDAKAVRFVADSDSSLTKGLAALLVLGLSGSPPQVIAGVSPEFVHLLGLGQSLTPSRNNGFLNMLKLMQQKALEVHAHGGDAAVPTLGLRDDKDAGFTRIEDGPAAIGTGSSTRDAVSDVKGSSLDAENSGDAISDSTDAESSDPNGNGSPAVGGGLGGRAGRIRERLEKKLSPSELEIDDISYQHAGHAGVAGNGGGETHFNLRVVSKAFEGKSLVKRHRLVYDLLQEELQSGLHALSIVAKSPSEVN